MVSVKSVRRIGAATLILPALDHLIAPTLTIAFAPAIMNTMFGTGAVPATIFFILLGIFQLSWIPLLLKSNNSSLLALGALGNLISITIYFVSVVGVTLPFGVPPQPFTAFAVLVKALEAVFVLASLYLSKTLHTLT